MSCAEPKLRAERRIDLKLGKNSNMDAVGERGRTSDEQLSLKSQQEILILPHTDPNINTRRKINININSLHLAPF